MHTGLRFFSKKRIVTGHRDRAFTINSWWTEGVVDYALLKSV
jgi:hypothetical protein